VQKIKKHNVVYCCREARNGTECSAAERKDRERCTVLQRGKTWNAVQSCRQAKHGTMYSASGRVKPNAVEC